MSKKKKERIPVNEIKSHAFRRTELPADLEQQVRTLWETVREGAFFNSFEQFEATFLRDLTPEAEIAAWDWIVKRYLRYRTDDMTPHERKKLMGRFLEESLKRSPIKVNRVLPVRTNID